MLKELENLTKIIKTKTIIATILIIFIGSIPAIFLENLLYANLFNQLLNCFTANFHLVLLLLAISINIISLSSDLKNSNFILRYKNYQDYLKSCFRKNLMYIFLILFISFFFCLFTSLVSVEFKIKIVSFYYYNISNLTYLIFHLIRMNIYFVLISMIIFYFNQKFGNKPTLFILLLFLITFFIPVQLDSEITSVFKMPYLIGQWFYILPYSSFKLEILVSIFQGLILFVINLLLKYLCIYKRKDI